MIHHPSSGLTGPAAVLLCSAALTAASPAALSFTDISFWTGLPAGPGVAEAALVLDWGDGSQPLVWGYRWDAAGRRTGLDMIGAIIGADSRLSVDGLASGFIDGFGWDADGDGTRERLRYFSDNGTPSDYLDDSYWNYRVNNDVYYHPTDFFQNSHIVPPATVVVPLGNPYAAVSPVSWTESSTGAAGRELADGSWDGWAWGVYGSSAAEPVPANPVPEPAVPVLGVLAILAAGLRRRRAVAVYLTAAGTAGAAGPYPPGPGIPGTDALPAESVLFRSWAQGAAGFSPGPQKRGATTTPAAYGSAESAFGPADALTDQPEVTGLSRKVVSLGDGGTITLTFSTAIADGAGADFAVFENGFSAGAGVFAELAFVEVSSNGVDFFRFPAVSLTPVTSQISSFGVLDPRDLHNLAGKYPVGYGTPFDLAELKSVSPLLDVNRVTQVRLMDVTGSITPGLTSLDSGGRVVNDPWPTWFATGGFDLDAVGVIHEAPAPWLAWRSAHFAAAEPEDAAPGADPDHDGIPNLLEYATGTDPARSTPSAVEAGAGESGHVSLTFPRPASLTDITLAVEVSGDALSWSAIAVSTGGAAFTAVPGAEPAPVIDEPGPGLVRVSLPAAGRGFLRLVVTLP